MKIILRQDVENLGQMGEIVTVKNGFARNYLIPRDLAYFASSGAIKALDYEKMQYTKRQAQAKSTAENLASVLSELQVSIVMKVGEEGRLYGSVTSQMIADELKMRGYEIDKRSIVIEESIKSLGVFDVKVRLHTDVYTSLKIWVISEE